jgi:hypothetical protein
LHWAKAATSLSWPSNWNGATYKGVKLGDTVGIATIPVIQPGGEGVVMIEWVTPNPDDYKDIIDDPWHYCLMSRIIGRNSDTITFPNTGPNPNDYVRWNNNVVWRNVSIIEISPRKSIKSAVAVRTLDMNTNPISLKFTPGRGSDILWKEAEIRVWLNDVLYSAWEKGKFEGEGIEKLKNQTVLIKSADAYLKNLMLDPDELGIVSLQFNFLTREITTQRDYTYHIIQTDATTNEVIGGEVYEIKTTPRKPFYANAGGIIYTLKGDPITFTAADIGEDAIYNWYDDQDSLVYTGRIYTTIADREQKYKLEVIAESDGYKDYDEEPGVKIVPGKIESIRPNPASSNVTVTCVYNNVPSASITISDQMGRIYANYPLNMSPQSVNFNISTYTPGTYIVTLICDKVVADSKTFVKQ